MAGRYDLTVTSAVPTPLRDKPSPWGGLSGAGVFANGVLVAVIIIDERGSYSGDRLSAVPLNPPPPALTAAVNPASPASR